jgi:hypothetical protein
MCKKLICLVTFVFVLGLTASVANADIIAYWPFDEGSGDVAADVVGGFDAQLTDVDWVADQFGGSALENDRSGDEIFVGPGPTPTTQDLTLAFWMVDNWDSYCTMMNKSEDDSTAGYALMPRQNEPDCLLFRIGGFQAYGGWGSECSLPDGAYADGEWVHIVCTYDSAADTATIYVNGALVPNANNKNPKTGIAGATGYCEGVNDPDQPLYIVGQREGFGGIVDEVAIWDNALTPDEVLAVYTLGPLALDPRNAGKPNPDDEATDVPRDDVVLSWTPGESANTHDIYLGTVFDDVNDAVLADAVSPGQTATTYDSGRLEFGTTYYWRVDEVNAPPDSTVFKSDVWSFTTELFANPIDGNNITATASGSYAADQGPEKSINGSGLDANDLHSTELTEMWLSGGEPNAWIQYELDKVHKLHQMLVWNHNGTMEPMVGYGCKDVTIEYSVDGTDYTTLAGVPEFAQAPAASDYEHNTTVDFNGVAAKYVRLTANSHWGDILPQSGLSEVRFFSIPVHAREPSPDSGATDVDMEATLSWRAGRDADTHDVYLSTDEQAVMDGTAPVNTVTGTSDSASLDVDRTYYWRVNEVNDAETTTTWQGEIWNFTTPEYLVVDDFESYNEIPEGEEGSNIVYLTWIDGYNNPSVNGSTMGHTVAFEPSMETSIVYGGSQSAPLYYDNTTAGYSEVTANVANLQVGQDWTKGAPETLVLWVRGGLSNSAAGQLYVKINNTKVMYGGDLSIPIWKQFNVDLASLGINLSNITTLSIGVDGGGSGMLYVDDIALYRIAPPVVEPPPGSDMSLVGHWKLDETSGLTAADSSGYGNDGTLMNMTGTEWTAGIRDGALMFDGNGQIVDFGNGASLRVSGEATISAWAKMEPANEDVYMGICGKLISGPYNGFALVRHSSNVFRMWMGNDGGDLSSVSSDVTYNDTDWHHVVGVMSNNTGSLYVDGVKQAEEAACGIVDTGDYAYIGKQYSNGTDRYWVGAVDDVRIYYRALSAQEILGL